MKGKKIRGRRMEKEVDLADGCQTTEISLRFPLSAGLPVPVSQNHCPTPLFPSTPVTGQNDACLAYGGMRRGDAMSDTQLSRSPITQKTLPVISPHSAASPSSSPPSSVSPVDLSAPVRMDSTSSPCPAVGPDAFLQRSSSEPAAAADGYSGDFPTPRGSLPHGSDPEPLTTVAAETAHILFTLSTKAFEDKAGGELERRTDHGSKSRPVEGEGRPRQLDSQLLQPVDPAASPPALSLSGSPPPSHPPLPAAPCLPGDSPDKQGFLCGVCHRLFSTASSLTTHMRLHRGGRGLSCQHCGKAFIHNKRLQSHEAVCKKARLALPLQPKQEPIAEGEAGLEAVGGAGEGDESLEEPAEPGHVTGTSRPRKKGRGFLEGRLRVSSLACEEGLVKEDDHFIKVVDGHIIYFCTVCERSYMTLSSLKRHSNVHSWRRKYPCHYCDKVFALAEYRTKHEVWHTGERRYQCIFCWDAFPSYYNLKTHQKAVHGISPSLISSEKTVNGGYKQKVNALKLYRLLPMRSQKRAYKTYSPTMADGLILQADALPMDCSLPTTMGTEKLLDLLADAHGPDVKEDPDAFTLGLGPHQDDITSLAAAGLEHGANGRQEGEALEQRLTAGSSSGPSPRPPKEMSDLNTPASSVISYGHIKPSVIIHSTAVSSSVIVHSKQVPAGDVGSSPTGIICPVSGDLPDTIPSQHSTQDANNGIGNGSEQTEPANASRQEPTTPSRQAWAERAPHKVRKSHGKSDSCSRKPVSHSSTSESRGAGPLCQITVRIGEEAIVKRSISETDLRRDKDLSSSKGKKGEALSPEETRHSHHHHRHKHRSHRNSSKDEAEGEPKKKMLKIVPKERDYCLRQEVRDKDCDQDGEEDNLWRPYYSYKPKRKAPHAQKTKSWQRKLNCKQSLGQMQKDKTLDNHTGNPSDNDHDNEAKKQDDDQVNNDIQALKIEEEEREITQQNRDATDNKEETPLAPLKNNNESIFGSQEAMPNLPALKIKAVVNASRVSTAKQDQSLTLGLKAAECGTCGRWFSSARKRDKHELTHLIEFICMLCQASFHSQAKLEEHQKTLHPRPGSKSSPPPALTSSNSAVEIDMVASSKQASETIKRDCSAQVSRRSLPRHTCPQCNKTCKTATALTRHLSRHELRSPSIGTEAQPSVGSSSPTMVNGCQSEPSQTISDHVQSTPFITNPPHEKRQVFGESGEQLSPSQLYVTQAESQIPESANVPEALVVNRTSSVQGPQQSTHSPLTPPRNEENTPDTPLISTADGGRFLSSPSLHSVLVLNGPECLDYRTFEKKSLDALEHRKSNPSAQKPTEWPKSTYSPLPAKQAERVLPVPMSTEPNPLDRGEQGERTPLLLYGEAAEAQDLRVPASSCDPCEEEAQDLTMPTILAREREEEKQRERQRKQEKEREFERERMQQTARMYSFQIKPHCNDGTEMPLRVPKEEAVSPVPSLKSSNVQTTTNGTLQRHSKSPQHSPLNTTPLNTTTDLQIKRAKQEAQKQCLKLNQQGPVLPTGLAGDGYGSEKRPLPHSFSLGRVSDANCKNAQLDAPSQRLPDPSDYRIHDFPVPFIVPGGGGGFRSGKKHPEDGLLMSYPAAPLPFTSLGKMVAPADLAKLPFYRDPYPLLCTPQLLAYPYNLATLPMALNMMGGPGDKAEQLPFLPALFNYATAAAPYASFAPHTLLANPGLYSNSSSSSSGGGGGGKKRDGTIP